MLPYSYLLGREALKDDRYAQASLWGILSFRLPRSRGMPPGQRIMRCLGGPRNCCYPFNCHKYREQTLILTVYAITNSKHTDFIGSANPVHRLVLQSKALSLSLSSCSFLFCTSCNASAPVPLSHIAPIMGFGWQLPVTSLWDLLTLCLFAGHYFTALHAQDDSSVSEDTQALLQFKHTITKDPSGILTDWTLERSSNSCSWYGVTCSASGRVVILDLNGCGLVAPLPLNTPL